MAELICNTSVMQSWHQLGLLDVLPVLAASVCVPAAVRAELAAGQALGANVPDAAAFGWAATRAPRSTPALPRQHALGAGECAVLWLAMESPTSIAVLDDRDARRVARQLGVPLTGTLGLLVDAKARGLIPAVAPLLDELERHAFHMSPQLREKILLAPNLKYFSKETMMCEVTVTIPDESLASLRVAPEQAADELKMLAAVSCTNWAGCPPVRRPGSQEFRGPCFCKSLATTVWTRFDGPAKNSIGRRPLSEVIGNASVP